MFSAHHPPGTLSIAAVLADERVCGGKGGRFENDKITKLPLHSAFRSYEFTSLINEPDQLSGPYVRTYQVLVPWYLVLFCCLFSFFVLKKQKNFYGVVGGLCWRYIRVHSISIQSILVLYSSSSSSDKVAHAVRASKRRRRDSGKNALCLEPPDRKAYDSVQQVALVLLLILILILILLRGTIVNRTKYC